MAISRSAILGVVLGLFAGVAGAQELVISEAEFATWPEYCQARYVTVPPGQFSQWAPAYPRAKIDAARRLLGPATFERVHHYCYGLIWLAQSKLIEDKKQHDFALQKAQDEVLFTYRGLPPDSPINGPTFIMLGQICMQRGEEACAVQNLRKAITINPKESSGYSALAVFYRKQNKLALARDTLLEGDTVLEGKSPEIHYNLGLIYLDLGDTTNALERAHAAYGLGYPLPGLRNRLTRMGKWTPAPSPLQ